MSSVVLLASVWGAVRFGVARFTSVALWCPSSVPLFTSSRRIGSAPAIMLVLVVTVVSVLVVVVLLAVVFVVVAALVSVDVVTISSAVALRVALGCLFGRRGVSSVQ